MRKETVAAEITSESVTEGHPDKLCDLISDAVLDAYLEQDGASRVAMETMASKEMILLSGEVTSRAAVDVPQCVRNVLLEVGYDDRKKGLDGANCLILTNIVRQSPDIARGVEQGDDRLGAGDQGMMYGYACDDTEEYLPLSVVLSHGLTKRLAAVRREGTLPFLYPDGKAQVTVAYDSAGNVSGVRDVVISAQHDAAVDLATLQEGILREVLFRVISPAMLLPDAGIHINPTGRFVAGGPMADTGLTGRKIIVDTYGGVGRHGGGAFSGKDPTKVDRSAAYMARYAALNLVAAGLCRRCEVYLAYAIGEPLPVSVRVEAFGTERVPVQRLTELLRAEFDFSVAGIIRELRLRETRYRPFAAYGHFGRKEYAPAWERTDRAARLRSMA